MTAFFCKKCFWQSVLILESIYAAVLVGATNAKADTSPAAAQSKLELKPLLNNLSAPGPDYLGHLGGLKVRIPRNNIFIIEYDGDPSWLEIEKIKNKEKPMENSGIRAMSMRIQVVEDGDGSVIDKSDQNRQQSNDGKIIIVGMNSNSHFGNGNGLELKTKKMNDDPRVVYQKDTLDSYGLIKFQVVQRHEEGMTDTAKTNMLRRQKDYFVKRNQYGRVETWIECSVNALINNMCTHYYYPDSKRPIEVYLTYRAKYFQNWEQIQNYTTQRINSFGSF